MSELVCSVCVCLCAGALALAFSGASPKIFVLNKIHESLSAL